MMDWLDLVIGVVVIGSAISLAFRSRELGPVVHEYYANIQGRQRRMLPKFLKFLAWGWLPNGRQSRWLVLMLAIILGSFGASFVMDGLRQSIMWFAELMVLSVAISGVLVGVALLSSSRLAYSYFDKTIGEVMTATERLVPCPRYDDLRTLFRWALPPWIIGVGLLVVVGILL